MEVVDYSINLNKLTRSQLLSLRDLSRAEARRKVAELEEIESHLELILVEILRRPSDDGGPN